MFLSLFLVWKQANFSMSLIFSLSVFKRNIFFLEADPWLDTTISSFLNFCLNELN